MQREREELFEKSSSLSLLKNFWVMGMAMPVKPHYKVRLDS